MYASRGNLLFMVGDMLRLLGEGGPDRIEMVTDFVLRKGLPHHPYVGAVQYGDVDLVVQPVINAAVSKNKSLFDFMK